MRSNYGQVMQSSILILLWSTHRSFQIEWLHSEEAHRELVQAIKAEGQIVPILVRPHPRSRGVTRLPMVTGAFAL